MALRPREGVSWAEGSFTLIGLIIHGFAIYTGVTGEQPIPGPKWFDATFGIPSPTSGTTRAIIALDQGRLLDALAYNPVATVAGALAAVFPIYLLVSVLSGKALHLSARLRRVITWTALGLLFATWGAKLAWLPERYW